MYSHLKTSGPTPIHRGFRLVPSDGECPFARIELIPIGDEAKHSATERRIEESAIKSNDSVHARIRKQPDVIGRCWAVTLKKKLEAIAELPESWDSYDSPAPNGLAIAYAQLVFESLLKLNSEPLGVLPSVEGGVGFVFSKGSKRGDIECLNSGNILAVYYSQEIKPQSWLVDPSTEGITEAINKIHTFLNA